MVLSEVAALAKTKTVARAVFVLTVCGTLAAAARMVAVETHILRVINLVRVLTICNLLLAGSLWHELRQFCFKMKL